MTTAELQIKAVTTEAEWQQAKAIRTRVFIDEQSCPPEEEWDAHDATSRHLLGWVDDTAVATARWREVTYEGRLAAKLERFAVLPEYRGCGYGRAMVEYALQEARRAGFDTFVLHAQTYLEALYASLGFEPVGDVFMEAGISHVKMVKQNGTEA